MKVIDLLNKIANDEKLPKIIKYNDYILYYEKDMKDYYDKEGNRPLLDTQCQFILNDEVEIIEDISKENKKIKKINEQEAVEKIFKYDEKNSNLYFLSLYVQHNIVGKLNEIIDKVNGEENDKD